MNLLQKKPFYLAVLVTGMLVAVLLATASAPVQAEGRVRAFDTPAGNDITSDLVASGFSLPTDLASTGIPGDDRLFVVEKAGVIRIIEDVATGTVLATPFLNISAIVNDDSERGLLSLAFSPDYATSGEFYVYYTDNSGDIQIARYEVSGNPNVANAASAEPVLSIPQLADFHNGGDLVFGPDGYLYFGVGDDGFGGDSQTGNNLIGKLVRIDVVGQTTYAVPGDNPFVGNGSIPNEVWALGLRNPWRISFDRNGNLWIADVGDDSREEVTMQPASSNGGENYGWPCYEGTLFVNGFGCPGSITHTPPQFEYDHSSGGSITGGFVYQGSRYCNMQNRYYFADFNSGEFGELTSSFVFRSLGSLNIPGSPTTFGEDSGDEIYAATFGGSVYHIEGVVCELDEFLYLPIITKP